MINRGLYALSYQKRSYTLNLKQPDNIQKELINLGYTKATQTPYIPSEIITNMILLTTQHVNLI